MKRILSVISIFILTAAFSGCAVVPALVTTGASLAVPQAASLAITAAGTVQKAVFFAADERTTDDMLNDAVLTLRVQGMLLTESGVDIKAAAFNGDVYLVGDYAAPEDRDRVLDDIRSISGVRAIKGVVKQRPEKLTDLVKPAITDHHAETVIEAGLIQELHVKSANVDVEVVQGEAVIMGVVRDREEAEQVVELVESLRPGDTIRVTSLLALQDVYMQGGPQENETYALLTRQEMIAAAPAKHAEVSPAELAMSEPAPELNALYEQYFPNEPTAWQKARRRMKRRILTMAKREDNPEARRELITLSSRVLKDRHISIEGRLVKTLIATESASVRTQVDHLLDDIAPRRAARIQTLAMN